MNEGLIIVPKADNDGNPLDHVLRETMGKLIAVYVRYANGQVQILNIEAAEQAA